MERRMDSGEALRDGMMAAGSNVQATCSLLASEQFFPKSWARCAGLLVNEWYYDLHNSGEHRVDPVIVQNQIRLPGERQHVRQVRQRYSTRTGLLSELV
jgi:hypothetical protein